MFSLPIRWTIGHKLQLLMLITLLPTFLVSGGLSLIELYQRERLAIQERASGAAHSVAERVDFFVVGAERMLVAIAEVPAVRDRDVIETNALFNRLRPQYRYYDNLLAIDQGGYAFASAQPVEDPALYLGDREYFRNTVSSGALNISGLLVSRRNGTRGVAIAYPVWNAFSRNGGVVAVTVEARTLQEFLSAETPPGVSVTIVAFDGQIIARSPDPERWIGQVVDVHTMSPDIEGRFSGVWEGTFLDETNRVMAFDTATRAPWRIFVGIPSVQAYRPLGQSLQRATVLFALTFVFAFAIAVFFSRRLARPIRQLAEATRAFVGDRPPAPVPVEGQDEVAELAIAFNKMLADLGRHIDELSNMQAVREADRLKSELLASVSHELKTPLGSIKGFASALQQDDVALDRATQRDFLATIEADADRLTHLVEDLLDMSRIEAGALRLELESCSIVELIQNTLARLGHVMAEHQVSVIAPADLPPIVVDPERIEQILFNLVDNAIKYSPTGSKVRISACVSGIGECFLSPDECDPHGSLAVAVEDEGIGIPPEQLERVFERFWRAESGRRRRASGTGLGLAICRGIIQAHKGRIWAENKASGGCRVTFAIPLRPDAPIAPSADGGTGAAAGVPVASAAPAKPH